MKKILSVFVKIFTKFIKVDENVIVMESNPVMQDNTGALYDKVVELKLDEKYEIIWFAFEGEPLPNKEFKNVKFVEMSTGSTIQKIKFLFISNLYYAKAKYIFFSHRMNVAYNLKKNQVNFNLTHGVPIKDTRGLHMPQEYVTDILTTSDFSGNLMVWSYTNTEQDKVRVLGYPRNDRLVSSNYLTDERYVVWLPTYRKHNTKLAENEYDYFPLEPSEEELRILDEKLTAIDLILYIKPHPAQKIGFKNLVFKNIKIIDDQFVINRNIQLYDLLNKSMGLITDYSSVYVDYLLVDRPIIFTFEDLEQYKKEWGFTVDDIEYYTPGAKVYDIDKLYEELENVSNNIDEYEKHRSEVTNIFHLYKDDMSSERVLKHVGIIK